MARKLYGERYADEKNTWLQDKILNQLDLMDHGETLDFYKEMAALLREKIARPKDAALLNCNDRYYLLTVTMGRKDAVHPWLWERSREVEEKPDDHLDLWARDHYKSTVITFSGIIQEILRDPNITIGIFSHTKQISAKFLKQIMNELEQNARLKEAHADCLWQDPANEAPIWGLGFGIVVKRDTNPKESTVEAHGLVKGQPTSKHFHLRVYDDVVTRESVTNEDQVRATTEAWELSDNLGGGPQRKWHIGTRYSFADTWGAILSRGLLKPRLFPATHNGRLDGVPVFLLPEVWENKKRIQASQVAAQMLQNPLAGKEQVFQPTWLRSYLLRPRTLNVYIIGDPSKGSNKRSDRTAIATIGIDGAGNKYLLDGFRHRMPPSERWANLRDLYKKWSRAPGVQSVRVGWERYGMQTDLEYFEEKMQLEGYGFPIDEVSWTREGGQSKKDRVERLQPDVQHSAFFLPELVWQAGANLNTWAIDPDKGQPVLKPLGTEVRLPAGGTMFVPGENRAMAEAKAAHDEHLIVRPILRRDEEGMPYDLTRAWIEEAIFFPFGTHDDLLDASSRIYDMQPVPPVLAETSQRLEALVGSFPDA